MTSCDETEPCPVTITGFGLNVHMATAGQVFPALRVTGPVNPYNGLTIARSVIVVPAVIVPSELLDIVTVKSGAFRVIVGVGVVEHLFESITLHALTVIVVSLVIVPNGGAV